MQCISGLQNMSTNGGGSAALLKLISALAEAIELSPAQLTAQGVGNSLYGELNPHPAFTQ